MEIKDYDIKKPASRNRHRKAIITLLSILGVLVAGTAVCVVVLWDMVKSDDYSVLFFDTDDAITASADSPEELEDGASAVMANIEYNGVTYTKNENIVNILFLGIDTNKERSEKRQGYRSDMVMVCAVDVEAKTATLISIPRDTYTTVYKRNKSTGDITEVLQQKINTAYSYGGGASHYSYDNACLCTQLFLQRENELETPLGFTLDIPVNFYAGIDMDGISKVASAVGGVEVTLDYAIPGVGSKGDTVLLKGSNAEDYIRNRHDTGGDLNRAQRQRVFMMSLAKKIKGMGAVDIILSLSDELAAYVDFNLDGSQMLAFAKVLMDVKIDAIETYTIEGEGTKINGTYYYIPDEEKTLQLLLDVYYIASA